MFRLLRLPVIWLAALLAWYGFLWFLSSIEGIKGPQPIPHFDKFQHFAYFLGGGLLFAGFFFLLRPENTRWKTILISATLLMAALGFIDEWHQCYTPGRSGGDPWDWLADVIGGSFGAWLFKSIHHRLLGISCKER